MMRSESGVTSRRRTSLTSPLSTPAWIAAPTATTSSGLTPRWGSLPVSSLTSSWMTGMRVGERLAAALGQIIGELLELAPRDADDQVLRPPVHGRDEGQVDLGLLP